LKIYSLKSVNSTQTYIKKLLDSGDAKPPLAVYTSVQTNGLGSRDNLWQGKDGNLFLSFAIERKELPEDLQLESASIYFSYLLKEVFEEEGSQLWIKWPNDFYLNNLKIGGMITNLVGETLVCGVGINLVDMPEGFGKLDIEVNLVDILKKYFIKIEKKTLWKQVFSKYKLEFYKNKKFYTHINNLKISLEEALIQEDGSIMLNGERIYSLR
jgi:BirA family biotin operon repressor/biotin-[acetyl-CoA-carboxylase] ligase